MPASARDPVKGKYYTVTASTIELFGIKGDIATPEKLIIASGAGSGNASVEAVPEESVLADIKYDIEEDKTYGKDDKLAGLIVDPRYAVLLYLEGGLTRSDFNRATETDGGDIIVPGVIISGITLTVRIIDEIGEYLFYLTDKDGILV